MRNTSRDSIKINIAGQLFYQCKRIGAHFFGVRPIGATWSLCRESSVIIETLAVELLYHSRFFGDKNFCKDMFSTKMNCYVELNPLEVETSLKRYKREFSEYMCI